jgi:hypothetical protein
MSISAPADRVDGEKPAAAGPLTEEEPMPQYLLTMYQPDGDPPPPEVLGPMMEKIAAWRQDLQAAGAWVFTGGLHPASTATVVRSRGGDVVVTDGPFAEGKEHMGGFTVISVPDLDAALEWGRQISEISTLPCEVWPLRSSQEDVRSSQGDLRSTDGS